MIAGYLFFCAIMTHGYLIKTSVVNNVWSITPVRHTFDVYVLYGSVEATLCK